MIRKNIDKVFIAAAGMGTRLKPYTDTLPKPMVEVWGKPVIGHILDHCVQAGVREAVINLHHKADILRDYFKTRNDIHITESFEENLLDTGGGVKKTLDIFQDHAFFMINGDSLWCNGPNTPALQRLAQDWHDAHMDILLLLQPTNKMILTQGVGDYVVDDHHRALRQKNQDGDLMFAGVRIVHPRIFQDTPDGKFPFLSLMDRAETQNRLYATLHDGDWHHISTADDLHRVNDHGKPPS